MPLIYYGFLRYGTIDEEMTFIVLNTILLISHYNYSFEQSIFASKPLLQPSLLHELLIFIEILIVIHNYHNE